MTTRKSIIDIQVNDGPFKAFAAAFAKYQVALGGAKKDSEELAAATKKAVDAEATALAARKKAFESKSKDDKAAAKTAIEAASLANAEASALRKKAAEQKKGADDQRKARADDVNGAKELAKWTGDIARNLASGAISLGKWLTFGAIASGFGLGGLASNASSTRRQAQGYGISTGDLRAAGVNFGKYINPEGALSNIANLKNSNDSWAFNRVGVNTAGRSGADILPEYLLKAVEAFKAGGQNTSYAEGTGLTKIISADELRALSSLSKEELASTIKSYQSDRGAFANDDATNKSWQDFLVSLQRASQAIEVSLLKNLKDITPYLEQFAKGIASAIDAFVSSGQLKQWIQDFGEGLKTLGAYLGSKEFKTDVQTFLEGIQAMGKAMATIFYPFIDHSHQDVQKYAPPPEAAKSWWQSFTGSGDAPTDQSNKAAAVKAIGARYNLPPGLLDTVWALESRRGANNVTSSAGAGGDFQIMPGVAANLGVKDRWDFGQSANGASILLRQLLDRYHGDTSKALAAYNWRPSALDEDVKSHGADWLKYAPAETQKYVANGGKIMIENNTGGNAQVNVAGLAGN